jgi:TatD DNase family protein
MFLVDSHCHLDLLEFERHGHKLEDILATAKTLDVKHLLNVCVALKDFEKVLAVAKAHAHISASVGLHPNEQTDHEPDAQKLVTLAQDDKVVAIGETGLDYFRSEGDLDWQRNRFREHIRAAINIKKPLIIHTRAAKLDTIQILKEENAQQIGGVMHCFTEDWETAKAALDLNFYISFSGIVTFKSASDIQEVAKKVPLSHMLIETDSPYLAPNPHRGKQNEPAFVRHVAEFISALRNVPLEEFANQTTDNFFRLFTGAKRDAH